jgi:hypothetical protein
MARTACQRESTCKKGEKWHVWFFIALFLGCFLSVLLGKEAPAATDAGNKTLDERRRAFAASPGYDPYKLQKIENEAVKDSKNLWNQKRYDEAYQRIFDFLKEYPLSIRAVESLRLMSASQFHNEIDPEKKKRAQAVLTASEVREDEFLRTIFSSGDGKSPATAYWVLTISEEYYTIDRLGYQHKSHALQEVAGKKVDVLKTVGTKGDERTFYFDVSHFQTHGGGQATPGASNAGAQKGDSGSGKEQVATLQANTVPSKAPLSPAVKPAIVQRPRP